MSKEIQKLVRIPGHKGIYRILILKDGRFVDPPSGRNKFAAKKRGKKFHYPNLKAAIDFRMGLGNAVRVRSHGMVFRELWDVWKSGNLIHLEVSTQQKYLSYFKHFSFFEDFRVSEIEPLTIDQWISWLKRPSYLKLQNSTRCNFEHEFQLLKTVLKYYSERIDRTYRLPFIKEHMSMAVVKDRVRVKKDLSYEEFLRFVETLKKDVLNGEFYSIFYLSQIQYLTFSRVQEAAALHFEDFDLECKTVHIQRKIIWPRVKGSKPILQYGSKTGRTKIIPICEDTIRLVKELSLRSGRRKGPLFLMDSKLLTYRQIEHRYTKALKACGINQRATHILRHASLTEHLATNGDLTLTRDLAGHSTVATTQRYAKVRDQSLRDSVEKFSQNRMALRNKFEAKVREGSSELISVGDTLS